MRRQLGNNPSLFMLRLMKAPEHDTLSPRRGLFRIGAEGGGNWEFTIHHSLFIIRIAKPP